MTKEELKQAYIHGNLSKGVVHCDKTSVQAGLEKLTELIATAESANDNSNRAISNLQGLTGFYGVVKNNCLAEDNLLYDLDIPSYNGSNTEDIVEDFKKDTEELKTLLTSLKADIEATVAAIDVYNNRDAYSPGQLAAAAESISLFDDYQRLSQFADKYSLDQFNGGQKLNGYSSGGGGGKSVINSDIKKREIDPIPTHSPTPILTPTPTITKTPTKTKTESEKPFPTPTPSATPAPTITPTPTKTRTKKDDPIEPDPKYVVPVGPEPTRTGVGISIDPNKPATPETPETPIKKKDVPKGTLASSITTANMRKEKVSKINKPIDSNSTQVKNDYIIPTAAALSASAAAGIGTKAYIDYSNNNWRKEDDDDDEEKKDEINTEEWDGSEDDMNVEYGIKDSTEIIEELDDDEDEKTNDNFNFTD